MEAERNEAAAFEMFANRSLAVRTDRAVCSSADDQQMITARIEASGGFKLLDSIILNIRKQFANQILGRKVHSLIEVAVS